MEKWNKKQEKRLKELNEKGLSDSNIAKKLNAEFKTNRSYRSIETQRRALGISKPMDVSKKYDTGMTQVNINSKLIQEQLKEKVFESKNACLYKSDKSKQDEKAVLVLSDIHDGMINSIFDKDKGKKLETYNTKIQKKEFNQLVKSISRIKHLLHYTFNLDELIIYCVGDIVTNDRIFYGQLFEIDRCVGLQVVRMSKVLTDFILEMKKLFKKVTFIGMVGNHGRSNSNSKYTEPVENNYEYILFKFIEKGFENDKRVNIFVPDTRFYIHKIFGHKFALTHGDMLRGYTRNSIDKSIRSLTIAHESDFDVFLCGHYHRADRITLSEKTSALINGSFIPKDSYGFRINKSYSKPQQWFFGVSKSRSMTWRFLIDLDKELK